MTKLRAAFIAAVAGGVVLGAGVANADVIDLDEPGLGAGGIDAAAIGELGDTDHGECVKDVIDLPALNACEDANGRIIMDLPALKLVGPGGSKGTDALPETGANVGDIFALGAAAAGAGALAIRRLRF